MLKPDRAATAPAPHDGWLRLWEAIHGRPWPSGAGLARELLAAYHDFCRDWAAVYGAPPAGPAYSELRPLASHTLASSATPPSTSPMPTSHVSSAG